MKKYFLLLPLFAFLFAGCNKVDNLENTPSNSVNDQDEKSSSSSIPSNLISCDPVYFERDANGIVPDCDTFNDNNKVCSYHTKEQNGKTKNEPIQYKNACSACRFYGETGVRKIGSATFNHHGYIESGCDGVIWE